MSEPTTVVPLSVSRVQRLVSVIVPCRNEGNHIGAFLANVLRQQLPAGWNLQLIIADGMSDDSTRELLAQAQSVDPRVQWIDNPRRIASTGLNAALLRAQGEVIVRMDVHTVYAADYIVECLAALQATGADNVGGPWRAQAAAPAAPMELAAAAAFQSPWVAGGARSRRLGYDGWTDTVYLGCWPRATFDRFGHFDEDLVRNQDDEHNLRIVRGGGRVWQASRIHSAYRPRATLAQVFQQFLQYGYWKPFVIAKHRQAAALRHMLPGAFVASVPLLAVAVAVGAPAWLLVGPVLGYTLVVTASAATIAVQAQLGLAGMMRVAAVVAAYHVGYGIGSLMGWFDVVCGGRGRGRFASLTR